MEKTRESKGTGRSYIKIEFIKKLFEKVKSTNFPIWAVGAFCIHIKSYSLNSKSV